LHCFLYGELVSSLSCQVSLLFATFKILTKWRIST
jgi:hypothetical protein